MIFLVLLIAAAVAFHQSNLPIAVSMLPALALCACLGWRPSKAFLHGLLAGGIGLALGMVGLITMNLVLSGSFGLSSSGSVFLLARMLADGTALRYLEKVCPQQRFAVCTTLDELKLHNSDSPFSSLSDYFLWEGPLEKLGGFRAEEAEAAIIVRGTLTNYPIAQLRAAVGNGWHQLFLFPTGDGMGTYSEAGNVSKAIQAAFGPSVYYNYRHSRQIHDAFDFDWINRIHLAVIIASSLVVVGFVVATKVKNQPQWLYASVFLTTMVGANAFTTGALSGPAERYQSRVIWLMALLAGCFVLGSQRLDKIKSKDTAIT